jgi:outer membrane protein TolC
MNKLLKRWSWAAAAVIVACAAAASAQTAPDAPAPHVQALSSATRPATPPADPEQNPAAHGKALQGTEVTLPELVEIALARNPAIKSAYEHFEAQRARVPQARSLPDPMISGGWMGNITPFSVQQGDPSSYRGLIVSQAFPFPGKRRLRGQIADRQAQAAEWRAEGTRRQIVTEVKIAYYNYFYDTKAIAITQKNKNLLEKLEDIAETRYRVGKGIEQDVLQAQVEVARIDQKLIILDQQKATAEARLNTLLYRDPDLPLPPPAPFTPAHFDSSLQSLYSLAHANDPQLEQDRRIVEDTQDTVKLAQKSYQPNFDVAYSYEQRPDMPSMNGVMVGVNIPIFFRSKQRESVIEASHNLIGANRDLDERWTTVNYQIKQEYLAAKAAQKLMNLYREAIVPQSTLALESAMSSYEVGKVDFLSMLDNFVFVLNYEVDYYQELSDFQTALARMEPLVGTDLTE